MREKYISLWIGFSIFLNFIAGCNPPKDQLKIFNGYYENLDLVNAEIYAESKIRKTNDQKPDGDDLLWTLQTASVKYLKNDCNGSSQYFDKCENMLNYFDHQNEIASAVVSAIINDNAVAYLGEEYDGIMVNTYKALNFMILGQDDLVRVEFNRALDRQRIAREKFAKEIEKLKNQIAKEQQKNANIQKNLDNPEIQTLIKQKNPAAYEYQAYPDFINPFSTYLASLYFNLIQDHHKAETLIKESSAMLPENSYIQSDLEITENILNGNGNFQNTLWVIFENGLGPVKEEFRIDLPLFIVTNKVKYVGIALPKLKNREPAYTHLLINDTIKNYQTEIVADMDRVIQTEFNKDFQAALTRAIISATLKAAAQYALAEQNSQGANIASIVVAAYAFVTNAADVRVWTALPKNFQVAKLNIPQNREIKIFSPQGALILDLKIPRCNNAVAYVKIPTKMATPSCNIIPFYGAKYENFITDYIYGFSFSQWLQRQNR